MGFAEDVRRGDQFEFGESCVRFVVPLAYVLWLSFPKWWPALRAVLGTRFEHQEGFPRCRVITQSIDYCTRGLLYWSAAVPDTMQLANYRYKPLCVMATDALGRFGTRPEQSFSKRRIGAMLEAAGLADVYLSNRVPFWCAVATKK